MKKLEELLGEDLLKQVSEKLQEGQTLMLNDGSYIPKDRLDDEIKKRDALEKQNEGLKSDLKARDEQLTELQKAVDAGADSAETINKLKTDIAGMQKSNSEKDKEHEARILQTEKKAEVKIALMKAGARHPDLLIDKVDLDKMVKSGDKYIGHTEQIEALKTGDYKDQFGKEVLSGGEPNEGDNPPVSPAMAKLQKEYADICTRFGASSPQAISVKNRMYSEQMKTPSLKPETVT